MPNFSQHLVFAFFCKTVSRNVAGFMWIRPWLLPFCPLSFWGSLCFGESFVSVSRWSVFYHEPLLILSLELLLLIFCAPSGKAAGNLQRFYSETCFICCWLFWNECFTPKIKRVTSCHVTKCMLEGILSNLSTDSSNHLWLPLSHKQHWIAGLIIFSNVIWIRNEVLFLLIASIRWMIVYWSDVIWCCIFAHGESWQVCRSFTHCSKSFLRSGISVLVYFYGIMSVFSQAWMFSCLFEVLKSSCSHVDVLWFSWDLPGHLFLDAASSRQDISLCNLSAININMDIIGTCPMLCFYSNMIII